jgi:hypothetical protein
MNDSMPPEEEKPITATKPRKVPKKRGPKSRKIITAFRKIPSYPVDAERFASDNGISMSVLRQVKRFDKTGFGGQVKLRKNRETGNLMIWREGGLINDDVKIQYWLAELDSEGNPKLVDGAHSDMESVGRILAMQNRGNGTRYAVAQILLYDKFETPTDLGTLDILKNIQRAIDDSTKGKYV